MYAETKTSRTPDLRLSGSLSLAVHGVLLLLVGLAVTQSRARFTPPAIQTIRLDVDLPAVVATENHLSTPSASPVAAAVPQASEAPRPVMTSQNSEDRLAPSAASQEMAPAAPDSVAPAAEPAGGVTTYVATETTAKCMFGSGDAPETAAIPTVSGIPGAPGRDSSREGGISLQRDLKPLYPLGARQRGEEGTVVLETTVAPGGRASAVVVITSSGVADLDRAAIRAVERASFNPATEDGRAVEARARLTIVFRLTN
ncbi:MAG: TonB family protein [bacterium]|jgi:protein TonB